VEASASRPAFADPVFVLCNGRSGSTLLRFPLDAHPDLACPPETNLPALCAQLATVWSLIEGRAAVAESRRRAAGHPGGGDRRDPGDHGHHARFLPAAAGGEALLR
jgi:hypothetical protein